MKLCASRAAMDGGAERVCCFAHVFPAATQVEKECEAAALDVLHNKCAVQDVFADSRFLKQEALQVGRRHAQTHRSDLFAGRGEHAGWRQMHDVKPAPSCMRHAAKHLLGQ